MTNDISHLEQRSWFGQFTVPNKNLVFPGRLSSSLSGGLRIDWLGEFHVDTLHGINRLDAILEGGYRCAILGMAEGGIFDLPRGSRANLSYGQGHPQGALFGGDCNDLSRISGFSATITNFGEFCFPQGFKSEAPGPGFEIAPFEVDDREFSVWRATSYVFLRGNDVSGVLYAEDRATGQEVALKVVRADGIESEFRLNLRDDVEWTLNVKYKSLQTMTRLLGDSFELLSLFAYLLHHPVAPIAIEAFTELAGERKETYPVLISRLMHPRAIEVATSKLSAHRLPIRLKDMDFTRVLTEWTKRSRAPLFGYLSGRIEDYSGLATANDTFSRLILVCTLLENANSDLGGSRDERYVRPITEWAYITTQEKLLKVARTATMQEFGSLLSDLRNEIAHPNKLRKALKTYDEEDIYEICGIVEAALFSYSLSLLGVEKEKAINAQFKLV